MNHPNVFIDNPFTELIVDNFAGGGGTSTGIYMALGREVDIAINHDPEALIMHKVNHPNTRHICEDVFDVDPREVCRGRKVGLATFSPDCTHFSKARGSKPVEKRIRGLSWVMVKWGAMVRPRVMIMENVEEIQQWGPLKKGHPDPKHKGRTWKAFIACLTTGLAKNHPDMAEVRKAIGPDIPVETLVKGLGFTVEWRELRACHYGSPTIRKRLKLICRSDGRPIVWPEPTHGSPDDPMVIAGLKKLWRTAGDIIDWSIPCPSIFERARVLAENSLKRIAKGLWKFVFNCAKPFIVPNQRTAAIIQHIQHGSASTGCMPADEPLRTVTSLPKGGSMAVTAATMIEVGYGEREGQEPRAKDLNQPMGTAVSSSVKAAAVRFTAYMIKHFSDQGQRPGAEMTEPVPTVTAVDHNGIVTSHIVKMHERTPGQSMDEPAHTITGGGLHLGEVRAFLVKYSDLFLYKSTKNETGNHEQSRDSSDDSDRKRDSEDRHRWSNMARGGDARSPRKDVPGATTESGDVDKRKISGRERSGGRSTIHGAGASPGVDYGKRPDTAGVRHKSRGRKQAEQCAGEFNADDARRQSAARLSHGFKDSDACHTGKAATAGAASACNDDVEFSADRKETGNSAECGIPVVQDGLYSYLVKFYRDGGQDASCWDPLHTLSTKARMGIVTVEGQDYQIVDIGMRMLTPRELYRAQGFPESYIIDPLIVDKVQSRKQKKQVLKVMPDYMQVRMVGNSVCPQVMEALVRANLPELISWREGERELVA